MTDSIVMLDFETTGTDVNKCRPVQIAMKKIAIPSKECLKEFYSLINPEAPIPEQSFRVHGIDQDAIKDAPCFSEISEEILSFFNDTNVICGHNVETFDIPVLVNQINRVMPHKNLSIEDFRAIDTLDIWNAQESRKLGDAHKRFCHEPLEGEHDAKMDLFGNERVLFKMLEAFNIDCDIESMIKACVSELYVAGTYHFQWNGFGEVEVCFGKHNGKTLKYVVETDRDYLNWIIYRSDFPLDVKEFLQNCAKNGIPVGGPK